MFGTGFVYYTDDNLAALDYVSAVLFVAVPIVWIPLIIFFTITAFFQWLLSQCSGSRRGHDSYHYTDFDKEYFANQFQQH